MNKSIVFKLVLIFVISSLLLTKCEKDSGLPTDGDGNEYDTVVIGTQVWLAENLKTTKYNNGVSIPLVTDNTQWASMSSAAFCWYDNDPTYKENYGALYNWYAVNAKLLCPVGWHVPTLDEWTTLISYLGGKDIAGASMKDRDLRFWRVYEDCETNEFGFKARGGGARSHIDGQFNGLREQGVWWTSTQTHLSNFSIWSIAIRDDFCQPFVGGIKPISAISIRCIKNE
jgi:uncharacterized protein (TIGR02145 family)